MAVTLTQSDGKFYEQLPDGPQQTGDIWTGVPNGGLLPIERSSALLITPSCDLQNQKSDTLSFVPIIPLNIATELGVFRRPINGAIGNLVSQVFPELVQNCDFESEEFRKRLRKECEAFVGKSKIEKNVNKIVHWINFLESEPFKRNLKLLFLSPKERIQTLSRVITNAFSSDLHFVPKERNSNSYQAVTCHSVCLLRYVLTFPIEIFDMAGHCTTETWQMQAKSLGGRARLFHDQMPVRTLRLQPDILSDLLTRFVSLYCRIGSEDFSPSCVSELVGEM